jgi:serine/threonine protein kinase
MISASSAVSLQNRAAGYHHQAGSTPIPGYKLISPLGRGGFGEVWKCEAPGGIQKAIKIIRGTPHPTQHQSQQAAQEHRALKRIIGIRHPFILQLDRIEEIDGELMIVMELADRTLFELLDHFRKEGFAGVPREELLSYMAEVAEALDHMNFVHGLMHLDIKPGNLFLIAGHVKVADFGLVTDLGCLNDGSQTATQACEELTGITPLYVAPETLQGKIHANSDQYSLAIVFQELLTGILPFSGKNPRQLAMQHMMAEPNLQVLPPGDQPTVARALSKDPSQRFSSCLAFLHALVLGKTDGHDPRGEMRSSARIIRKLQGLDTAKEINLASTDFSHQEQMTVPKAAPPKASGSPKPVVKPPSSVPPPTIPRHVGNRPPTLSRANMVLPAITPSVNAEALPGYTFKECIGRSPLGEVWRVVTPHDDVGQVKMVNGYGGQHLDEEEKAIHFLQSVKHPGLVPYEIFPSGPGRLYLVSQALEDTLWERFQEFRAKRLPGIPRQEILPMLRQAATTLDDLFQRFELLHIAINPRNLYVPPNLGVLVGDFGLAHLLWAPTGQSLAQLNSRYSAPELADGMLHRSCDIYSLALVYQELVVGSHPLRAPSARSLQNRGNTAKLSTSARVAPDLDGLQPAEREVLARAYEPDPNQRFQSCLELIDALEQSQPGGYAVAARKTQKPAGAVSTAPGGSWSSSAAAPALPPSQVISEIVGTILAAWPVESINAIRYIHRRGELLHHRCGAMLVSGLAKAKLDGFRLAIGAELARSEDNVFVYRVPRTTKSFWKSMRTQTSGLEITLHLARPLIRQALLTDVTVQIKTYGMTDLDQAEQLMCDSGPRIVETLRTFLQATHDRRGHERFEYNVPLKVVAFSARGERGTPIQCQGKDISLSGLSFYAPIEIRTPQLKIELLHPQSPNPISVVAQLVRSDQHVQGSWHEVGVRFQFEDDLRSNKALYS